MWLPVPAYWGLLEKGIFVFLLYREANYSSWSHLIYILSTKKGLYQNKKVN